MSERSTAETAIKAGMEIPLFEPGSAGPQIWSAGDMNVLVRALNALLNPQIVRGEKDSAQLTDSNFLITLSRTSTTEVPAFVRMLKLATPTVGRPLVVQDDYLICRSWDGVTLGTSDINVAKQYKHRRSVTSETVLGVAFTYSYGVDPDDADAYPQSKLRVANDGADTEAQRIIPPWCPGEIVFAISLEKSDVSVSDVPLTLLDVGTSRQWAKVPD